MWFEQCGTAVAFLGSSLAVGMACTGSALGVGTVGRSGAGLLTAEPDRFSRTLILQILPGTQGLYGLVIWFLALTKLGFFTGEIVDFTVSEGLAFFAACMPVAVGCCIFGIIQGRLCSRGVIMLAKRPNQLSKSIILAIMVEFYAIVALLATFLMLNDF